MPSSQRPELRRFRGAFVLGAAVLAGCGARAPLTEVSPSEIPTLEARLASTPGDPDLLLRYAAALFAGDRCDSATVVATRGWSADRGNALGPLIVGQCAERAGSLDHAVDVYAAYLAAYPNSRGAPAVRARETIARRARASERARLALEREAELADTPPNPEAVAVLPLEIAGDSAYQPLGRGIAQMMISDFGLIDRFPLVERIELNALLQEMALAQTGRVDSTTAARVGHLIQAGRLVQGLATIPPSEQARLEASIVQTSGEILTPGAATGSLRELIVMEKRIVLALARRMGYQLSQAEQRRILENGTENLLAFLAYSRGLLAEDAGNFSAAAQQYAEAVRQDPGFQAARQRYHATVAVPMAQRSPPSQVTFLAATTAVDPAPTGDDALPTGGALTTVLGDIASTHSEQTSTAGHEQTTQQAGDTPIAAPPPFVIAPPPGAVGIIRIIFVIP